MHETVKEFKVPLAGLQDGTPESPKSLFMATKTLISNPLRKPNSQCTFLSAPLLTSVLKFYIRNVSWVNTTNLYLIYVNLK